MPPYTPRDTDYAVELCPPSVVQMADGHEARMERILVKELNTVEIRFSWWKDGGFMMRPLDLEATHLLPLLEGGFGTVLSDEFLVDLRARIDAHLMKRLLESTQR